MLITEAVLTEVGNALAGIDRDAAATFVRECYRASQVEVKLLGELAAIEERRRAAQQGVADDRSPSAPARR